MFRKRQLLTSVAWFLVTCAVACFVSIGVPLVGVAQQPVTLTVSSGAGLRDVMQTVKQAYEQQAPNVNITYNFAASGVLRRQIEQGAPVDIVLLASQTDMNALQSQNLLASRTRRNLLQSGIALIVPSNSTGVSGFQSLTGDNVRHIAIGEPGTVPLGKYAEEVFSYFGTLEQLRPKFVYARSALEIMSYVESGNADAGIVHDTNARRSNRVRIIALAPSASHSPVIYPIAALANSRHLNTARDFLRFLTSSQATAIFRQYGYQLP